MSCAHLPGITCTNCWLPNPTATYIQAECAGCLEKARLLDKLQSKVVVGGMPLPGLICVLEENYVEWDKKIRFLELQVDAMRPVVKAAVDIIEAYRANAADSCMKYLREAVLKYRDSGSGDISPPSPVAPTNKLEIKDGTMTFCLHLAAFGCVECKAIVEGEIEKERERCAKLAEEFAMFPLDPEKGRTQQESGKLIAGEIRRRERNS
jgi:hypothetical protein